MSGHVTPGQVVYFLGAIVNNIFLRIKGDNLCTAPVT